MTTHFPSADCKSDLYKYARADLSQKVSRGFRNRYSIPRHEFKRLLKYVPLPSYTLQKQNLVLCNAACSEPEVETTSGAGQICCGHSTISVVIITTFP